MAYGSVVISSGHSTKCQGMVGFINEVEEATKVTDRVAQELRNRGVRVDVFHDTVSDDQSENLNRIVDYHNSRAPHDVDISVHFNASKTTDKPVGTEVWYYTQQALAAKLSAAIAKSGLKDRGAKPSSSLFFLSNTIAPAVLLEICFGDSSADVEIYRQDFDSICADIADVIGGTQTGVEPPPAEAALFHAVGKCSFFGGPDDEGVSESEGLAFHFDITQTNQHLFLPIDNGTGLARRLNPWVCYLACRWDYAITPKGMLANSGEVALVRNVKTGQKMTAFPADWGPHEDTGRVADLSPELMEALDLVTDDEVEVIYPYNA